MPEDFNEVILTPEEIEKAIFDARCLKYWDLQKQREVDAVKMERELAKTPFTTQQLKDFVLKSAPYFVLDEYSTPIFELLALYFSNSPEFEKRGYSLSKGICLCGPVGVGKTEMLNLFRKNKRLCFHMLSVFDIETKLQDHGVEFIKNFVSYVPGWGASKHNFYQLQVGWAFDDVGRESVVYDFGNKTDAISKILQTRYHHKVPFNSLHITTNKTPVELEERYDQAVRSRLREMFNYITYPGTDRRK